MKLDMLAKDLSSGEQGCDSCYLGEDRLFYVQAQEAPQDVYDAAANYLPGEKIVGLAPQVILAAADRLRSRMLL